MGLTQWETLCGLFFCFFEKIVVPILTSGGKVDLIVTQKVSNVSSDWKEMSFIARMLAAQEHPVGIYFICEDIFTLASYYQPDLRDMGLLPEGWQTLPTDELDEPMLSTLPRPAMLGQAEQLSLDEETDAME